MLHKDQWLSNYFEYAVYNYKAERDNIPSAFPQGLVISKIATSEIDILNALLNYNFRLIETALVFNQAKLLTHAVTHNIRDAQLNDKFQVCNIAKDAFVNSRFYQDNNIDNSIASRIKTDWIANYFNGERGSDLLVAYNGDVVTGFVLLIDNIIDLIAVAKNYQNQGVAKDLIKVANDKCGLLTVGTQLINIASINFYEKNNFVLAKSQYVLHRMSK